MAAYTVGQVDNAPVLGGTLDSVHEFFEAIIPGPSHFYRVRAASGAGVRQGSLYVTFRSFSCFLRMNT